MCQIGTISSLQHDYARLTLHKLAPGVAALCKYDDPSKLVLVYTSNGPTKQVTRTVNTTRTCAAASSNDSEAEAAATARASRLRTTASRRPPAAAGTSRPSYSSHASHSNTRCAPSRRPAACTRRRSAATRSRSSGRCRPSSDSRSTFYPSNSSPRIAPRDARELIDSRVRTTWLACPAS